MLDPHVEPLKFSIHTEGEIIVEVRQVVRDLEEKVLVDKMVGHVFRIENGLIRRWDWQKSRQKLSNQAYVLEQSNADLRRFAYIASHDLKEPLRTVACFAELLSREYQGCLDKAADEYITYITCGVRRMAALIDGVLRYSLVDAGSEPATGDASQALRSALANLTPTIAESHAIVTHESLPSVRANETQLAMVFQNLIANAIKYIRNGLEFTLQFDKSAAPGYSPSETTALALSRSTSSKYSSYLSACTVPTERGLG